jgi:hypothetical protein
LETFAVNTFIFDRNTPSVIRVVSFAIVGQFQHSDPHFGTTVLRAECLRQLLCVQATRDAEWTRCSFFGPMQAKPRDQSLGAYARRLFELAYVNFWRLVAGYLLLVNHKFL